MLRNSTRLAIVTLLLLAIVAVVPGCKGRQVTTEPVAEPARPAPTAPTDAEPGPPPVEPPPEFPGEPEPTREELGADELSRQLQTVYFAYDSSELTETARSTLRNNAQVIKANPSHGIVIEGHCDERGSVEYNLALGQSRANVVRDYLTTLGVERNRLRVVSYGEERPATPGSGESTWSKNRRAQFLAERN
jgi:peptidoglycan-associated lipoprotein